jgi:Xaa-Pro aminopeptidase
MVKEPPMQLFPQDFAARRRALMDLIGPNSVAIFIAPPERTRSHDTTYPYRASSDILYLSGFAEPESVLVLAPGHELGDFALFTRPRDPAREQWDGRRAGPEGARQRFGADAAYTIDTLDVELPRYLAGRDTLYYTLGHDEAFDQRVTGWFARLRHRRNEPPAAPASIRDARDVIDALRVFKSEDELAIMRRACQITSEAHELAMRACRPGIWEYQLQSIVESHFRMSGASYPSYTSIVGAGDNATILHYIENESRVPEGSVVLIDAGCELQGYAADITRSFPASGKFEPAHRDLYQAILDVQIGLVDMIRPGLPYASIQDTAAARLTDVLIQFGLIKTSHDEAMEQRLYKKYYPHGAGHWLGLDVHDVGSYFDQDGRTRTLAPGMVLTIEPGLYIPASDEDAPAALRGVGIRIEDDILVTEAGYENMTISCPKSVEAIEAITGHA